MHRVISFSSVGVLACYFDKSMGIVDAFGTGIKDKMCSLAFGVYGGNKLLTGKVTGVGCRLEYGGNISHDGLTYPSTISNVIIFSFNW
jgi:hypothetical protein